MRVTDDRYCRDRLRFDLALRLIGHEARTRTIRAWTGLTEDRVRKLYRTYITEQPGSPVTRRRGKSPQRCSYFLRSARVQQEAAVLAGLPCMAGIVRRELRLDPRALSVAQGELLCIAYEAYLALVAQPSIAFGSTRPSSRDYRKYYGIELHVVDWSSSARTNYEYHGGLCNPKFWNKEGLTWSLITAAITSFRIKQSRCFYSSGSPTIFNEHFPCDLTALAFLNSLVARYFLKAINPTVNTTVSDVCSLPFIREKLPGGLSDLARRCISFSTEDWDSAEISWDFTSLPLLNPDYRQPALKTAYQKLRVHWQEMTLEMQRLEEENNRC